MSSIVARTGRHLQRYENDLRLVSGCIPYRLAEKDEDRCIDLENRIEVLMVSSPNRNDMVFPKGGWENDETVEEAACREAVEEAGVRGVLKKTPLGVWVFRSKSKQELCSQQGGCKGYMFALKVTEELDAWPEQTNRHRKWLLIKEAFDLCRYEWMRSALEEFLRVISNERDNRNHEMSEEEEITPCENRVLQHPVPVVSVVGEDEEEPEGEDNDDEDEDDGDGDNDQMISTKCHMKHPNSPMSTSFGIMLPTGIFL